MLHAPIIPESEVDITAVRAQGAGGQNVNKVSSAAHLRFDIQASALPESLKVREVLDFVAAHYPRPADRDAIIDELGDAAQAMLALDQSYTVDFPLLVQVHAATTSSASELEPSRLAPCNPTDEHSPTAYSP